VIQVPGQPEQRIRRQVFDLVGPGQRRNATQPAAEITDAQRVQRGLALLGETAILVLPCQLSETYLLWLTARAVVANEDLLLSVARRNLDVPGDAADGNEATDEPFPGPVYDFAAVRQSVARDPDAFIAAPNIFSYHRTQEEGNGGEVLAMEGYDLVANGVGVRPGASRAPFEVRLRQGVLDTTLEGYLVPETCCGARVENAAATMAAMPEADWVAARAESELQNLPMSPDAMARMAADIRAGYVVVVPRGTRVTDEVWWRIDPIGGTALGSGRTGWGQGLAEKAAKVALMVGAWIFCEVNAQNEKDSDFRKDIKRLCKLAAVLSIGGLVWGVAAMGLLGTFTALGITAARYVSSRPMIK
jgi:hypothetical protein